MKDGSSNTPPAAQGDAPVTGALLMTAAASMMAGAGLLIQLASRHASDTTLIFICFVVGTTIALPLAVWRGLIFTEQTHIGLQILRALSSVLQIALFFLALRTLPLVDSVLLRAAAPIWVPILLQLFWKRRMPGKTWLFIGAGFVGLVLVLQPFWTPLTIGYVFAITSGISFAFQNIFTRQLDQKGEPPLRTLVFVFLGGAVLSAVPAASAWETPPVGTLLMLLVIGVVMVSASFIIIRSFHYAPAYVVAPFQYIAVIVSALLGWIFFDHVPNAMTALGCVIVVAVCVLLARSNTAAAHHHV